MIVPPALDRPEIRRGIVHGGHVFARRCGSPPRPQSDPGPLVSLREGADAFCFEGASSDASSDHDLRDTAVTWLARSGCTLPEICQITGHSMQSAQQTLKHYLASHPQIADNAIKKLVAWMEGQG